MIEVDLLRRGVTAYRHTTIEGETAHICWASFAEATELVGTSTSPKARERDLAVLREAERVFWIGAR